MTTEDRLRDAFRADAETIQPGTIRPAPAAPEAASRGSGLAADRPAGGLHIPAGPRRERGASRPGFPRPGWVRGLRPAGGPAGWARSRPAVAALAAAVAVIAIAVAATVAGSSGGSRPGALSVLGAPTPPAPRYLVGTVQLGHARGLGIFNARTGKRTGVVRPPGRGMSFLTVAATAPGRFIAAAVHSSPHSCSSARLYRLTLTSRGKLGRLAPLPGGRVNGTLTSLGASAGGRVIAYAADHCNGRPGWLGVIRPATGQSRRWPLRSGGLLNLTLTPDGRTVYFLNTPVLEGDGSIRAMSTSAPAGPMTRRARIVLGAGSASASDGSIALAGHGRILLACQEIRQTAVLTAYRAATGGELAVLHTWPHVDVAPCALTAASSGGYLLISDIGTYLWRMQLGSGGTRQLPIGTDAVDQLAW